MSLEQCVGRHPLAGISRPHAIAATTEFLAVGCFSDSGVVLLRTRTLETYGQVRLDAHRSRHGASTAACPVDDVLIASDRLFIAQAFSEFVLVADLATGSVIERLPLGG